MDGLIIPRTEQVAKAFADALLADLGGSKFALMQHRNANETMAAVCHSHDFCDANMVMDSVLRDLGVDMGDDQMPDATLELWNKAWGIAKREHLTAKSEAR